MKFSELITKRFSVKKFDQGVPVPAEKLDAILEAGRVALTARNSQPQHVYVLESTEALAKMDEVTPCRYGAPVALLVTYYTGQAFVYPGGKRDSGVEDASIVATHMILAAADEGVDSCWVNRFDPDQVKEVFGLAEDEEAVLFLDLGTRADSVEPLTPHFKKKPLEELVSRL